MAKRSRAEAGLNDGSSRSKKRRETTPEVDGESDHAFSDVEEGGSALDVIRDKGMRIWQSVKDVSASDGRILSTLFLVQPDKRSYPDYYQLIKRPIALSDIKRNLNNRAYTSLEQVKDDFDLCFNNARTYNAEFSQIFADALEMQKVAHKVYKECKHTEKKSKEHKQPSLRKTMKSTLQQLVTLADDYGRTLSGEFMELPDPKVWAIYYKQIENPQCFDVIFKKIKKKEYASMAQFADDVELVFSNCQAFNQEHTLIWEDAEALRTHFRHLMKDLPPPFAVASYAQAPGPKIKIKPPQPPPATPKIVLKPPERPAQPQVPKIVVKPLQVPVTVTARPQATQAANPLEVSQKLPSAEKPAPRLVSAKNGVTKTNNAANGLAPTPTPARVIPQPKPSVPAASSTTTFPNSPVPSALPAAPIPATPAKAITRPAPVASTSRLAATPAPPASYVPPATPASSLSSSVARGINSKPASSIGAAAPAQFLRFARLETTTGRPFILDHQEGVKTWFIRLRADEDHLRVSDVSYFQDDDIEVNGEGDGEQPKKRGRGRPPRVRPVRATKRPKARKAQVLLNGQVVEEDGEVEDAKWNVLVPSGNNTVEIGEKGGFVWKIYAQRLSS